MSNIEALREITQDMTTQELLRFLITEKFPQKTLVTCSLRGRSVAIMKMISDIDPSTPIVFCHAPNSHPESQEYRARLVAHLGLSNIQEAPIGKGEPLPDDCNHNEGLWAEDPVDHIRTYATACLNQSLAEHECWISAVYHAPFTDTPGPRLRQEGKLIRVDPLAGWTREDVRGFMKEHGLPYHPRATLPRQTPVQEETDILPTSHF